MNNTSPLEQSFNCQSYKSLIAMVFTLEGQRFSSEHWFNLWYINRNGLWSGYIQIEKYFKEKSSQGDGKGWGFWWCLCSREYGSRMKVDRRDSFTFLFIFSFFPLLARRTRAAVVDTAIPVREFILRVLSAPSSTQGFLLFVGAVCY